ncbi:MAG: carbamoyl-phosphate synthase large subunit [Eubacteriales bacterium]|nr:carbamoyl-phosphate synthase large subunit [Eubacteriales bacterium]MDD3881678.1 carbamoyl-phosphate synthase large subunit [Eubacteriales bacterium]MDD4512263.1 carbamoyl-phosphate synthase large subunit [Eubacteriales bacterium]
MPKKDSIKKVLVIGSGPIVIGQAAEFDYAGTQACRVLKEEGIETVLVNSNPATIMTDTSIADKVYLEPLNKEMLISILRKERPDSLLPSLGGQTGLNLAMELAESGILEELGVTMLGTPMDSIRRSEDREAFKDMMLSIGEPCIDSVIAEDVETAAEFSKTSGFPLIIRPAYTLGGTGGGMADNEEELRVICADGLRASRVHQVLVEKSVAGWKEIEYEVIRDGKGNCITVCNMENMDPVGVHTGDSIVVAPSQTLRDVEHQMLRSAAIKIISTLGIEGGCNVQYALDPVSLQYYVIEVNPRVSRSSALASKATGYPIAKVSTRIAIGYGLDEIVNGVTGKTYACAEPTLDYVVVKYPRWPFDKFTEADKSIGTKMKATGEVMAIGVNFEAALLKAVRSLEMHLDSLTSKKQIAMTDEEIEKRLHVIDSERMLVVAEALRRSVHGKDFSEKQIYDITKIDFWFLEKLRNIIVWEEKLKEMKLSDVTKADMSEIKKLGFADSAIASFTGSAEIEVRARRKDFGILPAYRMVDTCGGEFAAVSPYYYSAYGLENEATVSAKPTVVVLGSGPIRIGQGIEFDFCSVHCVWALKKAGYETVIINNNPETVSTDFDTSDRLFFEPLTQEDVWNILEQEQPVGVVCQFGGQTAIKLAKSVRALGFPILGTDLKDIDAAEDRELFNELLAKLGIPQPSGGTVFTADEAAATAARLGYPVLVRPSYVLGGQGMEIAYDETHIRHYMSIINMNTQEHPILVDKYLMGREIEVDAICDGENVLIPGIMEHVERAGIHSGDSISVYPPQHLSARIQRKVTEYTVQLARSLNVKGLVNIQFIEHAGDLYIIEVNPRSSRTIPYISKVTGIPIVELGVRASLGEKVPTFGFGTGLYPPAPTVAVKMPVFSFEKLPEVEVSLGPEMKSTGEILGLAPTAAEAFLKGFISVKMLVPHSGGVLFSIGDKDKSEALPLAESFDAMGFDIYATAGTTNVFNHNYIATSRIPNAHENMHELCELLGSGKITLIITTPTHGRDPERAGFRLRRLAVEYGIPCITSLDTAKMLLQSIKLNKTCADIVPMGLHELEI